MKVFHHVDGNMELIWYSETRTLVIGFTDGGRISIVIPAEKLKALSLAIWDSAPKA